MADNEKQPADVAKPDAAKSGAGPGAGGSTVIEVENLVTHYGDRKILNGVTMDVREGEIMVIMGGSGSGKSTLLRHLMALETKTSGTHKRCNQNSIWTQVSNY